jgi:AsmA protein
VGQSVDAIMKSLSGAGRIALGRGSIEGIDLDDLMGNFDVQGGTTVFDSAQANFTMQDGALRNNDLQMLLPHFDARGAGTIDLGARRLDYTLTPRALRVNGDRGLAVPIRITGPWADPSIRADLSAALDLNFSAERDRAETKVKEKLEEKLAEELGVVRQEGQSIEEAVEDRLENKLAEELFKLFD